MSKCSIFLLRNLDINTVSRADSPTFDKRGDLMQKALNYLKSFWNQLFLYLKDGRYNIDRSALPLSSSAATERICYRWPSVL